MGKQKTLKSPQMVVRPLEMDDYNQLVELQVKCFPGMKTWSKEQIESQLKHFQAGQIVVVYKEKIIGSSSALVIDFDEYADSHSWSDISDRGMITNHDDEGDTLYGIEIMVDPEYRSMKIGRRLYEARKELEEVRNMEPFLSKVRLEKYRDKLTEIINGYEDVVNKFRDALNSIDGAIDDQLKKDYVDANIKHAEMLLRRGDMEDFDQA